MTNLVQTRIDPEEYAWLCQRANSEGISIAACLRRLIYKEKIKPHEDAIENLTKRIDRLERTAHVHAS